eukprot:10519026-Lingulodinium_polyedra.AAC.1
MSAMLMRLGLPNASRTPDRETATASTPEPGLPQYARSHGTRARNTPNHACAIWATARTRPLAVVQSARL